MSEAREIWFTDKFGVEVEHDVTLEAFTVLLDDMRDPDGDDEHTVVAISDSNDWYVEFSREVATLGQAEKGGEHLGDLPLTSRDDALAIARAFLESGVETLRTRPWS